MNTSLHQAYSSEAFRQMGYQLVNLLADHLQAREQENDLPAIKWQDPNQELAFWQEDLQKADKEDPIFFFKKILDRSVELHNPKYMGHQISPPLPVSALAGFLSDFMNNGMGVYEMGMAATAIEKVVVDFVNQYIGYDATSSGVLTSGGTLANLTALLAARKAKANEDVWNEGHQKPLALMVSEQAHYCVDRAARIMGWGDQGIIKVPVDDQYQMRTELLEEYLAKAEKEGIQVIAVVGSACSTSTGSFDDLEAIAEFCQKNELWFHVDGAHGAASIFSKKYKSLVKGIHLADSVVMDFHKMLMTPSITTALVFKDGTQSYATFSQKAQYLWSQEESLDWFNLAKRTFECTKLMLSIKAYSIIRTHGAGVFDEFVTTCYDNGQQLGVLVNAHPKLELALEPACNIVCFRYKSDESPNAINDYIRQKLLEEGQFYIVKTMLKGETWLRTTLTNPFTRLSHFEALLDKVIQLGNSQSTTS
jgi:L-2,4-diaminobutyrate decarboxylase